MFSLAIAALFHIPACGVPRHDNGGQSGQNDNRDGCNPKISQVDAADSVLGFSSNDVIGLLGEHLPDEVLWNETTQSDA